MYFCLFELFERVFSVPFLFEIDDVQDEIFRVDVRAVEGEFQREIVQQIRHLLEGQFYFIPCHLKMPEKGLKDVFSYGILPKLSPTRVFYRRVD